MDESIITARGLGCQSGNRFLIKDIDWDIKEKSRWIVLGVNGCGKTTLLSILAGYQDYSHGSIAYRGTDYRDQSILDIRKKMGFISNSFFDKIYQNESVMDLILSGLSGTLGVEDGYPKDIHIRRLKRMMKQLELDDKLDYPYKWLSKGQRQNILILRALLEFPETLVLDEPMTGLDVVSKEKMMRFVQKLAETEKHSILYVTHHFEEISPELFDNCLLMRSGQIYQKGTVEEMINEDVIGSFLQHKVKIDRTPNGYFHLKFVR